MTAVCAWLSQLIGWSYLTGQMGPGIEGYPILCKLEAAKIEQMSQTIASQLKVEE